MKPLRHLGPLTLALGTLAGTMLPSFATSTTAAAPAAPTVTVTARISTTYLPGSYRTVVLHRLTLHITGSNFTPGTTVRLAVMTASRWKVIARAQTKAQPAAKMEICGHDFATCFVPNDRAGTIDYQLRLSTVPAATSLLVLYRSAHVAGLRDLSL